MYRKHEASWRFRFHQPRCKKLQASKPNKSPCTDRDRGQLATWFVTWKASDCHYVTTKSFVCYQELWSLAINELLSHAVLQIGPTGDVSQYEQQSMYLLLSCYRTSMEPMPRRLWLWAERAACGASGWTVQTSCQGHGLVPLSWLRGCGVRRQPKIWTACRRDWRCTAVVCSSKWPWPDCSLLYSPCVNVCGLVL